MSNMLRVASLSRVVSVALALAVCSDVLLAQRTTMPSDSMRPRRVSYLLGGGFAKDPPFVRLGVQNIGYAATLAVEARTPLPGLRMRAEGLFADWGSDQRVSSVSLGALAQPSFRWPAVPYVLASAGAYSATRSGGRFSRGWTVGAGVQIPVGRQSFFFESRMHAFHTDERGLRRAGVRIDDMLNDPWQYMFTPITFGIRF